MDYTQYLIFHVFLFDSEREGGGIMSLLSRHQHLTTGGESMHINIMVEPLIKDTLDKGRNRKKLSIKDTLC